MRHSRRRSSLRRDEGRLSSARGRVCAVTLTALLAAASYGPAAAAERSLQPDTSPTAAAETGLQPDAFAPSPAPAPRIGPTAPALAVKTPPVHPVHVETVPVKPKLRVPEPPPAVHVSPSPRESVAPSTTRLVTKAAPSRRHVKRTVHRARPLVDPPVPLLALRGSFVFAALRASVGSASPTLEAAVGNRGLALPAALAFLVLAAASGGFLSLAYRLRREQVEV